MDDQTKSLFASKTFWGVVISLVAMVFGHFGYTIVPADQITLASDLATVVGAAGGLFAVYGRAVATKPVTILPIKAPAPVQASAPAATSQEPPATPPASKP